MPPLPVAGIRGTRATRDWIALQPIVDVIGEILLTPEHPCQRLTHHIAPIVREPGRDDRCIEFVRFRLALLEYRGETIAERISMAHRGRETQLNRRGLASGDLYRIVCSRLRA